MDAKHYLRQLTGKPVKDIEIVHIATLQAAMDKHGISSKQGIEALINADPMVRRAVRAAYDDD